MRLDIQRINSSIRYRGNNALLKLLQQYHLLFKRIPLSNNLIISANPRGGSTWLSDIFSEIPWSYTLYEPLNQAYMPEVKALLFSRRQYIPENAQWPEAFIFFDKLLRGHILHQRLALHPMSRNKHIMQIAKGKIQVLKFCRLNLMLPWLVKNFEIRPPVLLLRHPCAVVYSQMEFAKKYGGEWGAYSFIDTHNTGPYSDHINKYLHILEKINTQEEQLAALWCITNIIPLTHRFNNQKWITVSYEELLLQPQITLNLLSERLKFDLPASVYSSRIQTSRTSLQKKEAITAVEQIDRWQSKLSQRQIDLILDIVKRFEMDRFYSFDPEPDYQNLKYGQQQNLIH